MGINIYEFFELTMDKFSDYTDRYDIELQDFLSKYEDNTESLFIEYQRGYLKKHREAIISSMNEIEKKDPDSELVFSVLEKKLATNVKIFEFLENRKAELRSAPAPVVGSESKEMNASKDYSFSFFNDVNNGLVTKFDMITFLEPHNTIDKLQALIEAIECYKVNYIVDGMVYNETNKRPFSEDSFNALKELVFSEIEKLKNIHTEKMIPDHSNDNFPRDIFRDLKAFEKFESYIEKHVIDFYLDFSYLKRMMQLHNFMMGITDIEFVKWLSENNYISLSNYDLFHSKKRSKFESLKNSESTNRLNNFNNIFLD